MDEEFLENKPLTYAIVLRGNYSTIQELKKWINQQDELVGIHQAWSFDKLWITETAPSGSKEGVFSDTE